MYVIRSSDGVEYREHVVPTFFTSVSPVRIQGLYFAFEDCTMPYSSFSYLDFGTFQLPTSSQKGQLLAVGSHEEAIDKFSRSLQSLFLVNLQKHR